MPTGSSTYIKYKRESGAYTSHSIAGDATWKVFGHGVKITPLSFRNNNIVTGGCGGREPTQITPGKFEGAISVEHQLSNPWWLRLLTGNAATKVGTSPYTYYWVDTANLNGGGAVNLPKDGIAFTVNDEFDLATDSVRALQGCVLANTNISAALGGVAEVRHTVPFRYITKGTVGIADPGADSFDVFTFAHGTLSTPLGTPLANVQNFSLDIGNGTIIGGGCGSRFGTYQQALAMSYGFKASMLFLADSDVLDYMLGSTTVPTNPAETTLGIVFDNGLAGTNQRTITFKFGGIKIDEYTINQAYENPLIDEWTVNPKNWTVCAALNNTAAEP